MTIKIIKELGLGLTRLGLGIRLLSTVDTTANAFPATGTFPSVMISVSIAKTNAKRIHAASMPFVLIQKVTLIAAVQTDTMAMALTATISMNV